ncbi:DUF4446 family protein [Candidatus Gottesmanbacteria bacterium]|nr:DUF4446 family protein [Candidatus Gottesmanbacteria bacterium]
MVFNSVFIFYSIIIVWLVVLTIFFVQMRAHYNKLTVNSKGDGLLDILNGILKNQEETKTHILGLEKGLATVYRDGKFHLQHIGLVRFNPFSDTGGSQSFTLALLDGHQSGLVMTSLYARSGHRWYIKQIEKGKGKDIQLSKEEQEAIAHAHTI